METLKNSIKQAILDAESPLELIAELRAAIAEACPLSEQPIDHVRWVPIDMVHPNDYNPNAVAKIEMGLLYKSIKHDGYTQPVVTVYDQDKGVYVIVDGFHRYFTAKNNPDIYARNMGLLPIVVLNKSINDRMAATVRHNRARGTHSVAGMSNMVFKMLENGWQDADICAHLGMDAEELIKLKHVTGFSKLFANKEYSRAWEVKSQILLRKRYEEEMRQNNVKTE